MELAALFHAGAPTPGGSPYSAGPAQHVSTQDAGDSCWNLWEVKAVPGAACMVAYCEARVTVEWR
jgi:hypothetical protein